MKLILRCLFFICVGAALGFCAYLYRDEISEKIDSLL